MIPCSGSEIHRWNALDDLDDDISDRVHEDLIPFDDDSNEEYDDYGDPDLVVMDSFTSSENSTVDESEEGRDRYEINHYNQNQNHHHHNNNNNNNNSSSSEFSHSIDEDGLILALDDSTNRMNQRRQELMRKSRNNSDVVMVRVKKSVKYGNNGRNQLENVATKQRSIRMKASNQKDILRPVPSTSRDILQSYIDEIKSDGTMNSMSPTYGGDENNNNNIVTVRVKTSVKYGAKAAKAKEIIRRSRGNSGDAMDRPTIHTIHSDGTISSTSPTAGEENNHYGSSIVPAQQSQIVQAAPRVATIYSDGTIGYSKKTNGDEHQKAAIVQNPVQKIATIHSDGTISYRLGSDIGTNETGMVVVAAAKQQPSTVATIHSDGFITYSSSNAEKEAADAKNSPNFLGKKSVSFDNAVVTDTEDNDRVGEEDDDDEDMDDDICDNIDDSRYTRSLHSMPVLEEVTEEESPLHCDTTSVGKTKVSSSTTTPKEGKAEPSWLELKKSPSATTTMTPKRSNDEGDDGMNEFSGTPNTSDKLTSRWLGIKGLAASSKTTKKSNVTKYQSMDGSAPRSFAAGKKLSPTQKFSRKHVMLRVETCSTGSQSLGNDNDDESLQDLEAGGSSNMGQRRSFLCCGTSTSDKRPLLANHSKRSCCCRRRDWIAAILFVLIGITVGVGSYFIMHRVFVEKEDDLQQERIEDWTMVEESPFGNNNKKDDSLITSPDAASTTSNDFDPVESDEGPPSGVSLVSTEAPKSSTISTSNDFDSVEETEEAENDSSGGTSIFPDEIDTVDKPATFDDPSEAPSNAPVDMDMDAFVTASPTHSPTIAKIISAPVNGGMTTIIQDSAAINEVIRRARREIELLIFADDDLIGKFLRLVFHDCIGGCDGCVDMTNPKNNGLDKPIDALQPIADQFAPEGLSRTDIWMLASLVASELALPFLQSDLLFPMHWIGRPTCETKYVTDPVTGHCGVDVGGNPTPCSAKRGPHIEQPHGTLGTASMLEFFETEFGFDAQQVTAIMGAHSVGKMARENVGFMGIWDLTTSVLDGGYWQELVGKPPDYFVEKIDNSDLPNSIPDRHQWRGIIPDLEMETVVMLNVDVALVRNIGDMDANGNVGCAGPGILLKDCPSDTPFLPFAQQYNDDNRKFILDFRDVLSLMIDHGNTKPNPECPEGKVCVFDNTATNFGSLGFALERVSPPPTSSPTQSPTVSPTRAPPKSFPQVPPGQPQVSLDLVCYENIGDILVVSYDHVAGTDITFEVYAAENVDIVQGQTTIQPATPPLKSTLSCAKSSCHTFASKGGLQISTADLVGGGSDYVVLLFARGEEPNADLELLAGDSFRLEGCND